MEPKQTDFEAIALAVIYQIASEHMEPKINLINAYVIIKEGHRSLNHLHFKIDFRPSNEVLWYSIDIGVYFEPESQTFSGAGYIRTNSQQDWKFEYKSMDNQISIEIK